MKCVLWFIGFCMAAGASGQAAYRESIVAYRFQKEREHIMDPRAPLGESDFKHVHYFKPKRKYVCSARFTPFESMDTVSMPTSSGKIKYFLRAGRLEFAVDGKAGNLTAFRSTQGDAKVYFIPFKDKSNGKSTYGGGRYLELLPEQFSGLQAELDFNKAYNPWCAYSDNFNCPIPPIENNLAICIKAGEKNYSGERKSGSKQNAKQ